MLGVFEFRGFRGVLGGFWRVFGGVLGVYDHTQSPESYTEGLVKALKRATRRDMGNTNTHCACFAPRTAMFVVGKGACDLL